MTLATLKNFGWLLITFLLCSVFSFAQKPTLEPGRGIVREIAGGESHTYQITLQTGQLARFRLEQQTLDSALLLLAPDGKQIAEANLTDAGQPEAVWLEALQAGIYQVTVRGQNLATMRGTYRLEVTVQANLTAQDRKYLAAQSLLLEAVQLSSKLPQTGAQTLEKLEQALAIWREVGEQFWSAVTLTRRGTILLRLNQPEKAIPVLEQAIALQRELKNQFGEAGALSNLANAYSNLRQYVRAQELFEQSLALYRAVKDRRWEGLILYSLGNTFTRLNKPDQALAYYEQSLVCFREVKDRKYEGLALLNQGPIYRNAGQSDKAITSYEAALASFREAKDRVYEAGALNNLAILHGRLGQSEKALESMEHVLAIYREQKNRIQEAGALITIGSLYGGMGQMEKAIEYFAQGQAISQELKDKETEALALTNLGLAYNFLNQYEKAIAYLEPTLLLNRELKNRQQEGSTLNSLGLIYAGLSRFEKAIESLEQAILVFREIHYRLGEADAMQNLGDVYRLLGRNDKANEYYERVLPIFREIKYRVGEGNILLNLARAYDNVGRGEEAQGIKEQALVIFRELKYRQGESWTLLALGEGLSRQKQYEKALELFAQALLIARETKARTTEANTLHGMGMAKLKLGHTDEAVALLTESAAILKSIGDRRNEFGSVTSLAKAVLAHGNLNQAIATIEDGVRIVESLRSEVLSPESRASLAAGVQETYQVYTDLLMQLDKAEPTKGWNARAVEVSERQRARGLLELLTESRVDLRQSVDAALVTNERSLAQQLHNQAAKLAQATRPEQITTIKQQISRLEIELERAQADIRKASPRYAALTQPQPLKLKEIQQLLDADTLLLEYALGEEHSYVWAVTKDALTSYELPKGELIEKSARQVYDLLIARSIVKRGETIAQRRQRIAEANSSLPARAQELSQMILAPVAAQLGTRRLVIVADGALQYVPFAALPESVVGGQWSVAGQSQPLIVKHEIVSLPSASALAIQRREIAGRTMAPKMLAVIADPVFDRSDSRLTNVTSNEEAKAQNRLFDYERSIVHLAEKPDDTTNAATRKLVIPRLPFTKQEATQLLALAPKDSSLGALGFQANRNTVLNAALSDYRYVHVATHGVMDSERPGLSSLLLSMVDEQGKPQDGFLRANDIYNLKLPAEMVVLSACQTGLGKEIKGEGLVGLTRGFMYAGASRVMVSLWNVNDQATSELMTRFYQRMLQQGARPAAALRAAQVELWKQKQWKAPFYWAAFTLQGEWM